MNKLENRNQIILLVIVLMAIVVMSFLVYDALSQRPNYKSYSHQVDCSQEQELSAQCAKKTEDLQKQ